MKKKMTLFGIISAVEQYCYSEFHRIDLDQMDEADASPDGMAGPLSDYDQGQYEAYRAVHGLIKTLKEQYDHDALEGD